MNANSFDESTHDAVTSWLREWVGYLRDEERRAYARTAGSSRNKAAEGMRERAVCDRCGAEDMLRRWVERRCPPNRERP